MHITTASALLISPQGYCRLACDAQHFFPMLSLTRRVDTRHAYPRGRLFSLSSLVSANCLCVPTPLHHCRFLSRGATRTLLSLPALLTNEVELHRRKKKNTTAPSTNRQLPSSHFPKLKPADG